MLTLKNAMSMQLGSKARSLAMMSEMGLNVPQAFIISDSEIKEAFVGRKLSDIIERRLAKDKESACDFIRALLTTLEPRNDGCKELAEHISADKRYAVRSSATKEDLKGASFAGQYDTLLNVGYSEIPSAVLRVYASKYSDSVMAMCDKYGIDPCDIKMNVIVQEMLEPQTSGVVFTVNPSKLCDKEIVIEAVSGQGEGLVSGEVTPETTVYNWYDEKIVSGSTNTLLSREQVIELCEKSLEIQCRCGYPCDIEYSFVDGKLFFLQFRAITAMALDSVDGQWTTANFKDSGVSADVCKPYMWSLYKTIWDTSSADFFVETNFFKRSQLPLLSRTFFGRPYWNLGATKRAMGMIPSYVEREFDESLGVDINYCGSGDITEVSVKSIMKAAKLLRGHLSTLSGWESERRYIYEALLEKYREYASEPVNDMSFTRAKRLWTQLVYDDHFRADTTYFKQIFINTVEQPVYQKLILRFTDSSGFFRLIGGLENVSHMRPITAVYSCCRDILSDKGMSEYWTSHSAAEIESQLQNGENTEYTRCLEKLICEYGYHSDRELDVSSPCYCEEPMVLIEMIKQNLSPETLALREKELGESARVYDLEKRRILRRHGKCAGGFAMNVVKKLREQLWWREELRDLSTKYYYLVRLYTMRLAQCLCERGLLRSADDVWFLQYGDVLRLCSGELSCEQASMLVQKNRLYCESFTQFENPGEIGKNSAVKERETTGETVIRGVASNTGLVTGSARVVSCAQDLLTIRKGEILVAKYIDTGWTRRFSLLGGIVTENGGVLCHGSIVAREYGIPCIVAAKGVTKQILNGDVLCVDGGKGTVKKLEA